MKALHSVGFYDVDVLHPVDLAPRPRGSGDTVIAAEASGVNYAELYVRKGAFPGLPGPHFALGLEGVGTVIQAPADRVAPGRTSRRARHVRTHRRVTQRWGAG